MWADETGPDLPKTGCRRTLEVQRFLFVCFVLLASYLDGTKTSSEFNSYTVAYDVQVL